MNQRGFRLQSQEYAKVIEDPKSLIDNVLEKHYQTPQIKSKEMYEDVINYANRQMTEHDWISARPYG